MQRHVIQSMRTAGQRGAGLLAMFYDRISEQKGTQLLFITEEGNAAGEGN